MQATLFWACAVAPKRLRRFAHAQNDLIWTAADATELDLAAAPNGGYLRGCAEGQVTLSDKESLWPSFLGRHSPRLRLPGGSGGTLHSRL